MFAIAENMKWNHLPVAGGIYDQHPQLLSEWQVIFDEKAKYEEYKARETEKKAKNPKAGNMPRMR